MSTLEPFWDDYAKNHLNNFNYEMAKFIRDLALSLRVENILEVGCNAGNDLKLFPEEFGVNGIDTSEIAINQALQNSKYLLGVRGNSEAASSSDAGLALRVAKLRQDYENASQKEKDAILEKIKHKLDKAIKEQKDFLDGNTKKKNLTQQDKSRVQAAAQANASYEAVGGDVQMDNGGTAKIGKTNCLIVRSISDTVIDSGILVAQAQKAEYVRKAIERGYRKDYVNEGIILGTLLGKRLKTRDEERSLKTTRLDSGRIDKRLISELGFNNDRIFSQTQYSVTRPAHIHISVDASGSMEGSSWDSAMKTAVAIAKAASMTSSIDESATST